MYIWHWRSHGVFEMEQGLLTVGIGTVHIFQHEPAFSDSYSCVFLCLLLLRSVAKFQRDKARQERQRRRKFLRTAAGETWEDPTLEEWDQGTVSRPLR